MKKTIIVMLLFLLFCIPVFSEEHAQDLINYYNAEIMTIGYQAFGGMNLIFLGQTSSTSFGIQPSFSAAMLEYEDSGASYNSYKVLNTTGNISYITALAATLFGSYFPVFANYDTQEPDSFWNNYIDNYKLSLGFIIGGAVCSIVSAITIPLAQENLLQGVNQYNRHKIEEY